jgi:hypothetical protein
MLSRRGVGLGFIVIATLLFCTHYLTAAIYKTALGPGSNLNETDFQNMLNYTNSTGFSVMLYIALAVGIIYLILGEFDGSKKN